MSTAQANTPYDALRDHLLQADERAVYRALPHQVAGALSLTPRLTLETLVEATFRGDAVLHWEIHCPLCGRRAEVSDWLRHARHDHTCQACGGTSTVHLDSEVQVTFSPHPSLRTLSPAADDPAFQQAMRERFPPTTVHELMTVQAFRDWAQNELLPTGEYLEVRRIAIWFSDLAGSTALYARSGDPFAYHLIREHFDLVFAAINQSEGAVVKTIGDGIMAVFVASEHALRAALGAHQSLDGLNRQHALPDDRRLALKIGIHSGPSIVVTLNDRLDYFGTTVNVAARVSNLARGIEVVFTEEVYTEAGVQDIAASHVVEPFQSDIRGLDQPWVVYRLMPRY